MATNRDDLDVAMLAAMTGGKLNQIDQMTIEPVNKSTVNRGGGKSNQLDPRNFIPKMPGQPIQPLPNFSGERVISNEITTIPIPEDLKAQAAKYMQPQPAPQPVQQPITMGNIQPVQQNPGGVNSLALLLAIDKKLDTIVEKLELICKTAKIVRK